MRVRPSRRGKWADLAAVLSFVALGFWVTGRLWLDPGSGVRDNQSDQSQFEWMMAHGARVVTQFAYPFHSNQMNVPDGVNLMANTSVLSISLPMTPITLLFGPRAAFLVFLTAGMIATATAWYFLLSRVLIGSRGAGVAGRRLLRVRAGHGVARQWAPEHRVAVRRPVDHLAHAATRRTGPLAAQRRPPRAASSSGRRSSTWRSC